ncbi:MAG: rhodanese-like domain-containing protein [Eubacteriales bacterium]|nr:rhodanese-like domain-containing protein [Eubacteriales bacterium]
MSSQTNSKSTRLSRNARMIILALTVLIGMFATGCVATPQTEMSETTLQTEMSESTPTQNSEDSTEVPLAQSSLVSADEALKILKDNTHATLLDVRTPEEYAEGYIEGAMNIAVEEMKYRTDELPQDKAAPIIVYCRSGRRSAIGAQILINLGYTSVYDLGGIQDWPYEIVK